MTKKKRWKKIRGIDRREREFSEEAMQTLYLLPMIYEKSINILEAIRRRLR